MGDDDDGLSEMGFFHGGIGSGLFGNTWMETKNDVESDPKFPADWSTSDIRVSKDCKLKLLKINDLFTIFRDLDHLVKVKTRGRKCDPNR